MLKPRSKKQSIIIISLIRVIQGRDREYKTEPAGARTLIRTLFKLPASLVKSPFVCVALQRFRLFWLSAATHSVLLTCCGTEGVSSVTATTVSFSCH